MFQRIYQKQFHCFQGPTHTLAATLLKSFVTFIWKYLFLVPAANPSNKACLLRIANHFIWGACVLQYLEEGALKCPMITSSHLSPSLKIAVESAFLIVSHLCLVTLWINREWFWWCPANSCNIYRESHPSGHSDGYSSVPIYCMPPQFLHSDKNLLNVCSQTFTYCPTSSIVVMTTDNVSVLYCWHSYLHNTAEEHTNILHRMILRCDEIWPRIKITYHFYPLSCPPLWECALQEI